MATKGDISGLDVLQFGGVPIIPLVASATKARRSGVVQSDATGGLTRQRKKYFNQPYVADYTFYLDDVFKQDYLKAFFAKNEGRKFICYLSADRPVIEPYVVQVVSDWTDEEATAIYGVLSVTMEVESARDANLDNMLNAVYPVVGYEIGKWLLGFKEVVEAMPDEL